MSKLAAVGFDLGDTLCEYAGVPLNWEQQYPAALAAVAKGCALELSEARLRSGNELLSRYNTRRTPRPDECEYTAEHIFQQLLHVWGAPPEILDRCISIFFSHFRQTLRVFPDALRAVARLTEAGVPSAVLTDVPYGMPRHLVLSDLALTGLPFAQELVMKLDVPVGDTVLQSCCRRRSSRERVTLALLPRSRPAENALELRHALRR
jgi:FMN phosphatase YigB (HAD superfamily)